MGITQRFANVAKPGVVVSTIVEAGHVETVTFSRADTALGFDVKVERSDDSGDALAMHALAVAGAR